MARRDPEVGAARVQLYRKWLWRRADGDVDPVLRAAVTLDEGSGGRSCREGVGHASDALLREIESEWLVRAGYTVGRRQ